jgi:ComEC/Rec2-related protein
VRAFSFLETEPRCFSLPVAAAFGMALGFYPGAWAFSAAIAAAAFAAAIAIVLLRGDHRRARALQAQAFALGLVAGAVIAWAEGPRPSEAITARPRPSLQMAWVEGRLAADSSPAKNGFRSYLLEIERSGSVAPGVVAELSYPRLGRPTNMRVLSRAGPEIDSGSLLRVLSMPRSEAALGSTRERVLFARAKDIFLIDRGGAAESARSRVRAACRDALARVGKRSSGLLQALILGVRDSLAPGEAEAFKAAGCSHILALSGEHLSVLAVLAVAALRPLLGPGRARLGGATLASLFMWIAGPGPSLLRAVLMAWIGAVALSLDRPCSWLSSLALAFMLMLPIDPEGARSLSFTLSYLAVWGLAVLGPRFRFAMGKWLPPFLCESASASFAAQAAVSPLLAFCFGYLQFAGIPASMAAGPIVTLTMWWGMGAAALCSVFPWAAIAAIPVSDFLYSILMGIMEAASTVPVLPLESPGARVLASVAVAGIAAIVYSRPYAEYRASGCSRFPPRLRFAPGPASPARDRGPGHVQALRPEFPRK